MTGDIKGQLQCYTPCAIYTPAHQCWHPMSKQRQFADMPFIYQRTVVSRMGVQGHENTDGWKGKNKKKTEHR